MEPPAPPAESRCVHRARECAQRVEARWRAEILQSSDYAPPTRVRNGSRLFQIPDYKKGIQASSFVRSSRFRTDDRCQLPPRADLIPRWFSSIAMDASVSAPVARTGGGT